ncbi:MAG TPA: hypothetical protein PKY77_19765 [Phycisphaerae bacterium]|nr:hypothetical protein [Phycisphaerae bacterium]HRY69445.1 hypothetical protein [Phycisphaerae bacterium]HSA26312.1 hypothetical protein [Phycisphaerae bacterium]
MRIELTAAECDVLSDLVEQKISALGPEIHHTSTSRFREYLREYRQRLEGLLPRLRNEELAETAAPR